MRKRLRRKQIDAKTAEYRVLGDWAVWASLAVIVGGLIAFAFIALSLQGTL